jgi:hypothetical protein
LKRAEEHMPVSRSEFDNVSDMTRALRQMLDDLSEQEFEDFWPWCEREFGVDSTEIFDSAPSADYLHYYSNGAPDKGRVQKFLLQSDEMLKAIFEYINPASKGKSHWIEFSKSPKKFMTKV